MRRIVVALGFAACTVAGLPAVALADSGSTVERERGVGAFIREWFGLDDTREEPIAASRAPRLGQPEGSASAGSGIFMRGLDAGRETVETGGPEVSVLRLAQPDAKASSTYFTPRHDGFRLGISSTPRKHFDAGAGNAAHLDGTTANPAGVDLALSKSIHEFEVTASLGFTEGYGFHGTDDAPGSAVSTGLSVGYQGFVIGGGVRLAQDDVTVGGNARSFGIGAGYATDTVGVTASFVTGLADDNVAVDANALAGFTVSGRYRIVPGIEARAAGIYSERDTTTVRVKDADSAAIVGGIALSF